MNRNQTFIHHFLISMLFLFHGLLLIGQNINGYILDSETGEPLINAAIINTLSGKGTSSNAFGYYSLKVSETDSVQLIVMYVGYQKQNTFIKTHKDTLVNFKLKPGIDLNEITVTQTELPQMNEIGIVNLQMQLVTKLPTFAGEADISRVMQLMPGISSGKEGTSSLHVRGGSPDQNLIILDDMPIFFMNHIAGFISMFNPDAINYAQIYKGAFPAKYGGHLSSVLDIRMKEGDISTFGGNFTLGTITSRISIEGPIKKDTSSYIISFRRSFLDLLLNGVQLMNGDGQFAGINLWDFNAKYNQKLSNKTRYYFSFYKGRDKFYVKAKDSFLDEERIPNSVRFKYKNKWGNTVASFRLNHIWDSKTFINLTAGYTGFNYVINESTEKNNTVSKQIFSVDNNQQSGTNKVLVNVDLHKDLTSEVIINAGVNSSYNWFNPFENSYKKIEDSKEIKSEHTNALTERMTQAAIYGAGDFAFTERMKLQLGLRMESYFTSEKSFHIPQPRLKFEYTLPKSLSFQASYSRISQFVHLLTNNEAGLQTDIWVPSTKEIMPETSSQISTGIYKTFKKNTFSFSAELYYKTMNRLIELRTGSSFWGSGADWSDQIEAGGEGRSKGMELLFKKNAGKITGWVGYTLSKTDRRFENIDQGKWFAYKYDRRHDWSIVLNYACNQHLNLSCNWIYMTGNAVTLPIERYQQTIVGWNEDYSMITNFPNAHVYPSRNNLRLPAYHRLDVCANFVQEVYRGTRTWSIGLYNAYNHMNTYAVYFNKNKNGEIKLYSFTLFPILPSISYSLKF